MELWRYLVMELRKKPCGIYRTISLGSSEEWLPCCYCQLAVTQKVLFKGSRLFAYRRLPYCGDSLIGYDVNFKVEISGSAFQVLMMYESAFHSAVLRR